ncbi:TetR/AcrR family transcriptional regulator [Planctomycetota bacterium]
MTARERILSAADNLFGEVGFEAATTRQIAEASEVNKALIHYHFESKEKLFTAVLDRYYERLNQTLLRVLATGGGPRDRLTTLVGAYVDFLAANQNFSRMVQREASGGRLVDRIVGHMAPLFRAGVTLLEQTYPASREGVLSAPQLLISFYGMVISYFTYSPVVAPLLGTDPLTATSLERRKQHLEQMLHLVADALVARGEAGASVQG